MPAKLMRRSNTRSNEAASAQTKKAHDEQDNNNEADNVNYSVHKTPACLSDQPLVNYFDQIGLLAASAPHEESHAM